MFLPLPRRQKPERMPHQIFYGRLYTEFGILEIKQTKTRMGSSEPPLQKLRLQRFRGALLIGGIIEFFPNNKLKELSLRR
jgi:hypothetical protein